MAFRIMKQLKNSPTLIAKVFLSFIDKVKLKEGFRVCQPKPKKIIYFISVSLRKTFLGVEWSVIHYVKKEGVLHWIFLKINTGTAVLKQRKELH